jgi:hypothetical protein
VTGCCERDNETSGSVKSGEFLGFSRRTPLHGVKVKVKLSLRLTKHNAMSIMEPLEEELFAGASRFPALSISPHICFGINVPMSKAMYLC